MLLLLALLSSAAHASNWQDTNVGEWAESDWQQAGQEYPAQVDQVMAELQALIPEGQALTAELEQALGVSETLDESWRARVDELLERAEAVKNQMDDWGYGTQVIGDPKGAEHLEASAFEGVKAAQATQAELESLYYAHKVALDFSHLRILVASPDSTLGERAMAGGAALGVIGFDYDEGFPFNEQAVLLALELNRGNAAYADAAELCLDLCSGEQALAASQELVDIANSPDQGQGVTVYFGDEVSEYDTQDLAQQAKENKGKIFSYQAGAVYRRLIEPASNQVWLGGDVRVGPRGGRVGAWGGASTLFGLDTKERGYAFQGGVTLDVVQAQKILIWVNPGVSYDRYGQAGSSDYFQPANLGVIAPIYIGVPVLQRGMLMWVTQPRWSGDAARQNPDLPVAHELQMGARLDYRLFGDVTLRLAGERLWVPDQQINVFTVGLVTGS
ncbi:MAG: hypothetical protein ACI9VR_001295 [Cognaticolwellia sp.]|jgi:hypothetical protein